MRQKLTYGLCNKKYVCVQLAMMSSEDDMLIISTESQHKHSWSYISEHMLCVYIFVELYGK